MRSIASRAALAALIVLGAAAAARSDAPPDPTRITLADFKKQLDAGKLVVIDVRSTETYRADHIPGSISVPLSVVQDRAAELKASRKPIVAYCA